MKKRAVAIWRKDLVHVNKTRDNHFRYFGKYFKLILLSPSNKKTDKHITQEGTKVIKVKVPNSFIWPIVFYMKSFSILYKKKCFDIFICPIGEEPIGWLFTLLLFKRKPKLVFDLWDVPGHSITKYPFYKPKKYIVSLYHFILNRIINKGDIIIAGVVPQGLEKFNISPEKIINTQNGIQPEAFNKESKGQIYDDKWSWVNENNLRIIYVGYIHKTRGSDLLIQYAVQIKKKKLPASIMMIGPSDEATFSQLYNDIDILKLNNIIKIHKELPSSSINSIVSNADIGICPLDDIEKYRWSYPVKIYEYLKSGIAIVATDLPGISTILTDQFNGLLYKAGSNDEFIKKVDLLINNSKLRNTLKKHTSSSIDNYQYDQIISDLSKSINEYLD